MKPNHNPEITVIIPALNEEEGIGNTALELQQVLDDPVLLVIDGNSIDKTVEVAKQMNNGTDS